MKKHLFFTGVLIFLAAFSSAAEVFNDKALGFKVTAPAGWVDEKERGERAEAQAAEAFYAKGTSVIGVTYEKEAVPDSQKVDDRIGAAFAEQALKMGMIPLMKPTEMKIGTIRAMRFKTRANVYGKKDQMVTDQVSLVHKRRMISLTLVSKDSTYEKDAADFEKMANSITLSKGTAPALPNPTPEGKSEGWGKECKEDQDCPKNLSCIYDICQQP